MMGLAVISFVGFGFNMSGGGITKIGSVGNVDISVDDYARALRSEMASAGRQFGITLTMEQLLAFGMDAAVRQKMVSSAAIDSETNRLGLSVGDKRVALELAATNVFQGINGKFDRDIYRDTLKRNNLTEIEYEMGLRNDLSQALFEGVTVSNFGAPKVIAQKLYAYAAQTRGFTLKSLSATDLPQAPVQATEADLLAFYNKNIGQFTDPEAKRISYAVLLPSDLAPKLSVDETSLRVLYEENKAYYIQPERRLVERLAFATMEEARAAKTQLDAGESLENLVKSRGLSLDDIDMGDVEIEDLGAAGTDVFELSKPGIVGPFESDLGPALFRMNAILAAQKTTFNQARADLVDQYRQEAAARAIGEELELIDNRLAEGAELSDMENEFSMRLGRLDYATGLDNPLMSYSAFRETADTLQEGDFPKAILVDDGGVVVLQYDEFVSATPIPFEKAHDDVATALSNKTLSDALRAYGEELVVKVAGGGATLGQLGITQTAVQQTRDANIPSTPKEVLLEVFKMQSTAVQLVTSGDYVAVLQLNTIDEADLTTPDALAETKSIAARLEQSIAQDAYGLISLDLAQRAGIELNNGAINAVHGQMQ
jgi:peptidyl-prolyl cis-trans isomerase D